MIATLALDKVIMLHIATFNVFTSTIIAIVFYRTLEKVRRKMKSYAKPIE